MRYQLKSVYSGILNDVTLDEFNTFFDRVLYFAEIHKKYYSNHTDYYVNNVLMGCEIGTLPFEK